MELNIKIAKDLLKIKAVFFRPEAPFTWASGIKSPVYCDNRLTLSDTEVRTDVETGLATLIKENYPEVEVLMGTSTAGSCIEVVNVLREAGAEVLGIASIFTYGMQKGLDRLAAADVKNISLTNFDVIAKVAAEDGYIKPEDVERLIKFRNNPSDESWIGGQA